MMTFCVVEWGVVKCFREIACRDRVPARVLRLFYGLSFETVELNKKENQKGKKKGKKSGESSSFQQRDGFVFRASLSYSLFRSRTRGQRRLYLGRRVSLF